MTRLHEDDIKAIVDAVRGHDDCPLVDDDDRHALKTILQIYRESTTAIRKGFIGLVLIGALVLAIIGGSFYLGK